MDGVNKQRVAIKVFSKPVYVRQKD